ncbi:3-phosphoshikimate 1-carboxyvinyltransferase [Salinisphaera orenii MK-B5]|uniref:3-phosphoshikimate 1-carboxyvinyltransferase n=1 Tax=Salinisphaera orenii MK-B5 TaxID=856730 RepID=A0A423PRS3_9GAMM|nr:3-phosphoshikimate 1-carboxyvinyltransferase [Salinisphaera orenii]ROO28305.1 3-phosphoshikimate 1-carboxyvinyltransferase [Salinisphaera orenii MK-B5]
MRRFRIEPGGHLQGEVQVPGDKSVSHRAVMFAALASGTTRVTGFLESADCLATLAAFAAMGVAHRREGNALVIDGVGLHGLQAPDAPLDLGNAGTSMRLLSGLMAGQAFDSVLTGDASLSRRPMARVIEPLTRMGADIRGDAAGRAPLHIRGGRPLRGITYRPPVASAQIKSCVLLAGLYADGETRIEEPGVSRDHTERMLAAFGVPLRRGDRRVALQPVERLRAADVAVPADLSSAAFFMVAASIAPDSELRLPGVGINPTRRGVIDILLAMGADIVLGNEREQAGEPVADIRVRSAPLKGIAIGGDQVELAIDEFPAIFIAAACAEGTTRLTGAAELRVKESDRIAVMADGLATLGVDVTVAEDGLTIVGRPQAPSFGGGHVASHADHRIAMAFAIAALRADAAITIDDCDYVDTSFPGFVSVAAAAGLAIRSERAAS